MITNEIMVGKHFKMKVNFNLVKKHGSEKRQIWLTATIKGDRCRVFTGERIEEQYWQKSNRTELGERAIENSQWGRVVLDENRRINKRLEYEENKEYYDDMKQDVAAALLGTLEMTEEELADLMGMERDSEEMDELIRRIFERKGWDYEED